MASGICSQSFVPTICGDVAGAPKSSGPAHNIWSPLPHIRFPVLKSRQEDKFSRAQAVRCTASQPTVNAATTEQDCSVFSVAALACTNEVSSAQTSSSSSSDQSAGYGSSSLEKWLEGYLTEIVRHLPEAPFLQLVPQYKSLLGERRRVSKELFETPENWQSVKQCLLESAPEGIILVRRLNQEALSYPYCMSEGSGTGDLCTSGGSSTDVWGLFVHSCKTRCSACYILKTTKVVSSAGILTHFYVSRAECFGPSLESQLQSPWLL